MVIRAEYAGKVYEFPDGVSDEQMAEAIQSQQSSGIGDVAKSAVAGVARGVAGLAGLPGDAARAMRWTAEQAGRLVGSPVDRDYIEGKGRADLKLTPTGGEVVKGIESIAGPLHEPQTTAGKYARSIGEFVPGAIGGPGTFARYA